MRAKTNGASVGASTFSNPSRVGGATVFTTVISGLFVSRWVMKSAAKGWKPGVCRGEIIYCGRLMLTGVCSGAAGVRRPRCFSGGLLPELMADDVPLSSFGIWDSPTLFCGDMLHSLLPR